MSVRLSRRSFIGAVAAGVSAVSWLGGAAAVPAARRSSVCLHHDVPYVDFTGTQPSYRPGCPQTDPPAPGADYFFNGGVSFPQVNALHR